MRTERDRSRGVGDQVGATIQLWRTPNRIWPAFPTLVVARAASRLVRWKRRRTSIGEGGVITVFLDGSKVGAISPEELNVYQVSPGKHSLNLHFLGGLRRSRAVRVLLAEGEEQTFICLLNTFGWPSIRPATPSDAAAMGDAASRGFADPVTTPLHEPHRDGGAERSSSEVGTTSYRQP